MMKYDDITKEIIEEYNLNLSRVLDNPCRILITRGCGSLKSNALLNFIKQQDDDNYSAIDEIYMLRAQMKQNINILLKNVKHWP